MKSSVWGWEVLGTWLEFLQETGEGIASAGAGAGAGASEGCETPDVGAGMKFQESSKPS